MKGIHRCGEATNMVASASARGLVASVWFFRWDPVRPGTPGWPDHAGRGEGVHRMRPWRCTR
jgi:hypothetical protein